MKNKIVTILFAILAIAILAFPIMIKDSYVVYGAGSGSSSKPSKAHTHNWVDNGIISNATCTEEGSKNIKCSICGKKDTDTIPALGHDWGDWVSYSETTHKRTCKRSNCGGTEIENHNLTYTSLNDTQHNKKCTLCKFDKDENHGDLNQGAGIDGHKCPLCSCIPTSSPHHGFNSNSKCTNSLCSAMLTLTGRK